MKAKRIMIVNWAPIWEGAHVGGGVNLYCQQIALELVLRGYEVFYVFSGYTYDLHPFSYIRRHSPWEQIHSFEIINSACLAPGRDNFGYPISELKNKRIIKLFEQILDSVKPDVIHFNNIEGFCIECARSARRKGTRVIFSLHNYYILCPQVSLLFHDTEKCHDYRDGRNCGHCIPHGTYWRQRIKRGLETVLATPGDPRLKKLLSLAYHGYHSIIHPFEKNFNFLDGWLRQEGKNNSRQNIASQTRISNEESPGGFGWVDCSSLDEIESPPPENPKIHSEYKDRRHGMIDSLNESHVILAVSKFVAQKFIRMGVKAELVQVNYIGSFIGNLVKEYRAKHSRPSERQFARPLRFVFIGNAGTYKGLPLLLESLKMLPASRRAEIELFLYAQHIDYLSDRIEALRKTFAEIHISNGYKADQLPSLLEDKDIGIVPPIWWDPAPQVVMELLGNDVPVLGANIGGIPDFVQNGVNGLLFQPGNPEDLAAKICYILDNPSILKKWRSNIRAIKTIEQHVDELQIFYGIHN